MLCSSCIVLSCLGFFGYRLEWISRHAFFFSLSVRAAYHCLHLVRRSRVPENGCVTNRTYILGEEIDPAFLSGVCSHCYPCVDFYAPILFEMPRGSREGWLRIRTCDKFSTFMGFVLHGNSIAKSSLSFRPDDILQLMARYFTTARFVAPSVTFVKQRRKYDTI